jgi:hypothetical protein
MNKSEMSRYGLIIALVVMISGVVLIGADAAGAVPSGDRSLARELDSDPPEETPKFVFVHASIGLMWLSRYSGQLVDTLGANNYFLSDYNFVNHPELPGHDYCNWPAVFGDAGLMEEILNHNGIEAGYDRPLADPGGENEVVMIKPCGTQYPIYGNPDDPPSGLHSCPMVGLPDGTWTTNSVVNVKQALIDSLAGFAQYPDKYFVVVTGPATPAEYDPDRENARAVAEWMRNEWLEGYEGDNVVVYDLYNVLTSNAEGEGDACPENPDDSDVGLETGNHHRIWNGQVQHQVQYDQDYSAYCKGHPERGGLLKATSEFVPLLNTYYNAWGLGAAGGRQIRQPNEREGRGDSDLHHRVGGCRRGYDGNRPGAERSGVRARECECDAGHWRVVGR